MMRAHIGRVGSLLFVGPLLAAASAQQPSSSALSPSQPVRLDVSVTDTAGKPIPALSAADFEVTEDGRPVSIESATRVDQTSGRRTYLFAVDSFHLSLRGAERLGPILQQFVRTSFGGDDRAAVAWLGPTARMSDVTTDAQRLLTAIDRASSWAHESGAVRLGDPIGPALFGVADPMEASRRTFAMLATAIQRVPEEPGRRLAVLLISEGVPVPGPESRATTEARRTLYGTAARRNANLYAIDPLGMSAISSSLEPSAESEPAGLTGWDSLRALARETAGRAIFTTKYAAEFQQIVENTSAYFVLTYQSPHGAEHGGDFHRVDVRVKAPHATVTARRGWYEPSGAESR